MTKENRDVSTQDFSRVNILEAFKENESPNPKKRFTCRRAHAEKRTEELYPNVP